ncbi:hypothetical protein EVJ58_g6545 [Rhodofomes roseus]|uniref:Uncharacterized protein n=1 Tax=Rhodofomes roseus TaxID=34475 RepID=A0A4Y9Y833_9APHY|nr:hypothetical protein EVJ58_g6545 [Rhodofomes roseus]
MRSLLTVSFYIARVNRCIHQCSALAHSLARASAGLRTQSISPAQLPFPTPTSASGLQALAPADDAELRTAQLDASVSSKANLHRAGVCPLNNLFSFDYSKLQTNVTAPALLGQLYGLLRVLEKGTK